MDMTSLNLAPDEMAFPRLGIDRLTVKSTAFTVFGVSVAWYGLIIAVGMILAIMFGMARMKKYGLSSERAFDVIIAGVIGGIIGARVYYVLMNWSEYSSDLKTIFQTRNGGLAVYGGVIGALLTGVVACKIRKVRILPLFDLAGMGRWGNFFNHEAFGCNTDLPWGMTSGRIQAWITENAWSASASGLTPTRAVHPCFLYESLWCFTGLLVLYLVSRKRKYDGQIFLLYIFWYGTGRGFIEGLRTDSLYVGGTGIRVSQLIGFATALFCLILLVYFKIRVKNSKTYVRYNKTEVCKERMEKFYKDLKAFRHAEKELVDAPSIFDDTNK